jgi:hypothetical protein
VSFTGDDAGLSRVRAALETLRDGYVGFGALP